MSISDLQSSQNQLQIDDGVTIVQNNKDIITSSGAGTQFKKNIQNSGGVGREINSGMQAENITKEMYVPSSMVTPLPDKVPWLGMINMLAQIAEQLLRK